MNTCIEETTPIAKKEHLCGLCDLPILKGTKYIRRYGIDEDGKFAFKMHIECEQFTHDWDEMDWVCFAPTEFRNELKHIVTCDSCGIVIKATESDEACSDCRLFVCCQDCIDNHNCED